LLLRIAPFLFVLNFSPSEYKQRPLLFRIGQQATGKRQQATGYRARGEARVAKARGKGSKQK